MSKKYFIEETTLIDIADSVRALTGSTESMTPGSIGNSLSQDGAIGKEVDEQADLIAQIQSAVNNLPEAGSGGAIEGLETLNCKINFAINTPTEIDVIYCYAASSAIIPVHTTINTNRTFEVLKGSYFLFDPSNDVTVIYEEDTCIDWQFQVGYYNVTIPIHDGTIKLT